MNHDPRDSFPDETDDEIASLLQAIPLRQASAELDARVLRECRHGALFYLRIRQTAAIVRAVTAIAAMVTSARYCPK